MAAHHGHVTATSDARDHAGLESASYARTLATKGRRGFRRNGRRRWSGSCPD